MITLKDVVSGLVTPIMIITATLGYSALIFSGPLAGNLAVGLGYGLVGAGVLSILFALFSGMPFVIAGPDSKPASVLATMAAVMVGTGGAYSQTLVLVALVLSTVFSGLALFILGMFKTGRWIRFVPFPVVGGFMAASGWLLTTGGARVLTGIHVSLATLGELAQAVPLTHLAAGVAFAAALHGVRNFKGSFSFPIFLIVATAIVHAALAAFGLSLDQARADGWLVDTHGGAVLTSIWFDGSLPSIAAMDIVRAGGDYVALVVVITISLLMSLVAIEVQTRVDLDMDRELRLNGWANIITGLCGGMAGTVSVSRTMFSFNSGARHRISGVLSGLVCLAMLALGTKVLDIIPVPLLGGLLIQLGLSMLYEWVVEGRRRMQNADFMQVLIILLVIMRWDFIAGIGVGVVVACVTFAVNTSRIHLVKLGMNRSNYASRVDRPPYQQELLLSHGQGIQILWLQGFVFFGSANRLLLHVREVVTGNARGECRSVILDFHQVLGIDSSAVMSLIKLRHLAEREGFVIAVADLPPKVETMLRLGHFLTGGDDPLVKVYPDMDAALEACEDRMLVDRMSREEVLRSADQWLARELGGGGLFARLVSYLEMIEYEAGETMFEQNESGNSLYLMYAGRVTILYRTLSGVELRLRSMLGHTIVGEMGVYRGVPRGASVRVDQPTIAYRLSMDAMTQMEEDDPAVAHAFHKFVIRTLAARLDFANREIAGLQN